jgi:ribosomal protein S18 acetylase RimI-like enzyme
MPAAPAKDLRILPLTPDRIADLAPLFDAGGDPKWCWCAYYRFRGRDWTNSSAAANRANLELMSAGTPAPGLVAYEGDAVVGWVSLGPRETYERLAYSKTAAPVDDAPVWSIVCFVVARQQRGRGIAEALLAAAVEHARSNGATMLEAYPVDTGGERIASANAFRGTLSMYERAGFEVVARRQATADSPPRPIVRLAL